MQPKGVGLIGAIVMTLVVLFLAGVAFWGWSRPAPTPVPVVITPTPTPTTTPTTGGGPDHGILPYNSGVTGVVMLGPTCPVERIPPDPGCADRGYQTLVAIFRASDPVHAFVLLKSAPDGSFKASLPPGEYVVGGGESNLPRCGQTPVTVLPNTYSSVAISCDTGIR